MKAQTLQYLLNCYAFFSSFHHSSCCLINFNDMSILYKQTKQWEFERSNQSMRTFELVLFHQEYKTFNYLQILVLIPQTTLNSLGYQDQTSPNSLVIQESRVLIPGSHNSRLHRHGTQVNILLLCEHIEYPLLKNPLKTYISVQKSHVEEKKKKDQ